MLELAVTAVRVWPGGTWTTIPAHSIELDVPDDALLDQSVAAQIASPTRRALSTRTAGHLIVFTLPAKASFEMITGSPGSLSVDRIRPE